MRFNFFAVLLGAWLLVASAMASPFNLGPESKDLVLVPGFNHADVALPIQPAEGGFDFSQVQVSSDTAWVTPQVDAAGQKVLLKFNTAALSIGNRIATITATHGTDTFTVTLTATSSALNVFKLMDDPHRSRMYGIQLNGTQTGSLLVLDPLTASPISSITVGKRPTGMAISDDGSELFVINCVDATISVIDLETLSVSETLVLPIFYNWKQTDTTANVGVGPGNNLYYTDAAHAPVLHLFDRSNDQVLQSLTIPQYSGFGDFTLNAGKTRLFAWAQRGWTSGSSTSVLVRYEVSATGTMRLLESFPISGLNSLETPIFVASDGEEVFVKKLAVDSDALSSINRTYVSDIYSISPGGEIVVTNSDILHHPTGDRLLALPVSTSIHAISSDYSRLVYFDAISKQLGTMDLYAHIGAEAMDRMLSPAHESIVFQPSTFLWSGQAGASGYHVYFGSTLAEVEAATLDSTQYLGATAEPAFAAPGSLPLGSTYYWRVDAVIGGNIGKGSVYSFTVSSIASSVSKVLASTVRGHANQRVTVDLDSASPGLFWSAEADQPWVTFTRSTGTTPGELEVRLDASNLEVGLHTADITVSDASGDLFTLPVHFKVEPLRMTHLKSDPLTSLSYAISEDTDSAGANAYMLELDTAAEAILRVVPVGTSVTDLAIHEADNRIYVPNWKDGRLLAFNKSTLAWEHTYPFLPPQGTGYSAYDVYRVAAGKAGRLVVEQEDQWTYPTIYDTVNGTRKGYVFLREGGGAFDPSGRFYYHGDTNSTDSKIHKLDVTGDVFTSISSVRASNSSFYGSRVVMVSDDGQSVFWNGSLFNADLVEQWSIADHIYSTSADGGLAFGETKIYDTSTRQQILSMPVATRVSAYNTSTNKLVVQDGSRIRFHPMEPLVPFNAPVLSPGSGAITATSLPLAWTEDSMETGFNLEYRVIGADHWIQLAPAPAANAASATLTGLEPGRQYEIRIQATSPAISSPMSNVVVMETLYLPPPTAGFNYITEQGLGIYMKFGTSNFPSSVIIERSLSGNGPWTELETLSANATGYWDRNVQADVDYYYRIKAVRWDVTSYSSVRTGRLPGPIFYISFQPEFEGVVEFTTHVLYAPFPYMLQRRLGTAGDWQDIHFFSGYDDGHYKDRDIIPGTTYQYRLKVVPETLSDKVSKVLKVTTKPLAPPPAPRDLHITDFNASLISLRWNDTYTAAGYKIERRLYHQNTWNLLATLSAGVTSYTDPTLVNGQIYEYRVTAFNATGDGLPAVIGPLVARDLRVTMEDDFDPGRDSQQWAYTSVTTSVDGGAGFNGTKALWFGNTGTRSAQSRPIDASAGGILEFSLRAGNSERDGNDYWENSMEDAQIVLEYSFTRQSWLPLQNISMAYPSLSDWTDFSVPITPQMFSRVLYFRWRQLSDQGSSQSSPWALDNVKIRSMSVDDVLISIPPAPMLVMAGTSASVSVVSDQPMASFQWYQDGELIPEATTSTYFVVSAQPVHAGSYSCTIRHGADTLVTAPVVLGVIEMPENSELEPVPVGGSFSLGMQIHPAALEGELAYSWTRTEEGNLAGIGTVSGEQTSTLAVTGTTASAASTYHCQVTYPSAPALDVGPYEVRLLPAILPIPDTDVISGSPVEIALVTADGVLDVQVRGLPRGLHYDAATRRILGSLTGNKSYTITLYASTIQGTADPVSFQLNVVGFPAALAGSYQGVFLNEGMDSDPAFKHGGQMAFKITNKGAASGTVMIQGKNRRFAVKNVEAAPDGVWARLEADIDGPDGGPLQVAVDIVGGAGLHDAELRTAGEGEPQTLAEGQVVRNEWSNANPAPDAGLINVALLPPEWVDASADDSNVPKGTGFLNLKLTPQGIVTCKGRLADGQTVTGSTILGPEGHLPVYVSLYRGTGSFGTLMTYEDGEGSGTAYWGKDDQGETSKDRFYKRGIERHELTVTGGRYVRPAANAPLFATQDDANSPATLTLTGGLLPHPGITQVLSFTGKHQADLPREKLLNPHGLMLKMNAATGTFTGKFKLEDPHPLKARGALRRTVSFQGSLIPGLERGCGYFLLPELPSADIPRSSLSNTPVWSGSVELNPEMD